MISTQHLKVLTRVVKIILPYKKGRTLTKMVDMSKND